MRIEFVGGARSVTGSSFIVKTDASTVMVDCGMFQGKRELRERNYLDLIYDPPSIDSLLLTHAHIDHSGLIPRLVKKGFDNTIFATKATADLCGIMLPDSAHIQEMDVQWVNRRNKKLGRDPVDPLYTQDDAAQALECFAPVQYGEEVQVQPGIRARFRDAGHILGSAIIELWVEEKGKETKIVFSGDLGQKDQAIIRDPEIVENADILLIESTYGDREHKNKADTREEFKNILLESYNDNGNIVIPAFAVERTQEIIYVLADLFRSGEVPRVPVYIDSPLAISATEIFRQNRECFDEDTARILLSGDSPLDFPELTFTRTADESKRLNREARGSIIISASGMCTAGRIKFHLQNNLYHRESSVVFVGYQAEGTLGRRLVDGAKKVRLYGEDVVVKAKVHTIGGFSAHADRSGLLDWIGNFDNPGMTVFVVHGEENSSMSFSEAIRERYGLVTHVPRWGEIVSLDTMKSQYAPYGNVDSFDEIDNEMESLEHMLATLKARYAQAKEENRNIDLDQLEEDINDIKGLMGVIVDEL
ncbi:MAG: MBL fold metallo-hydrolase RNA specificity domain-containing protein [Spirochaetota bacterium]